MGKKSIQSPARLKVVVAGMFVRLDRMKITIQDPKEVHQIPGLFFETTVVPAQVVHIEVALRENMTGQDQRDIDEGNTKE
jgi:hypothetical protein